MRRRGSIVSEPLENRILTIRDERAILDLDLAEVYGGTDRFPSELTFLFNAAEKHKVVKNCDPLNRLKFSPVLPRVFIEYGAIMAGTDHHVPYRIKKRIGRQ